MRGQMPRGATMQALLCDLLAVTAAAACACTCPGDGEGARESTPAPGRAPRLVHLKTVARLPAGTHRPELLAAPAGGFLLAVVQPQGAPGIGQVKHQLHLLDAAWRPRRPAVPLTRTHPVWGEPADHRAILLDGELVMVYQSLNWRKGRVLEGAGPAEDHARDQSLVLARFDGEGKELSRRPLVERSADLERENFPDHCLLWTGRELLVGSGTRPGGVVLREVSLDGQVLQRRTIASPPELALQPLGNSLLLHQGALMLLSSTGAGPGARLTVARLEAASRPGALSRPLQPRVQGAFPTGVAHLGDLTAVTYIAADRGPPPAGLRHAYSPRLLLLDRRLRVVADAPVGEGGYGHVHPTVVQAGGRIFVAWSRRLGEGPGRPPAVQVDELKLLSAGGSSS